MNTIQIYCNDIVINWQSVQSFCLRVCVAEFKLKISPAPCAWSPPLLCHSPLQRQPLLPLLLPTHAPPPVRHKAGYNLSGCDCTNGGRQNGFNYIERAGAPDMALLYGVQGTIAGLQMILYRTSFERGSYSTSSESHPAIRILYSGSLFM